MYIGTIDGCVVVGFFFFFKQKTAYEMRISDWSSDVCSSDLKKDAVKCQRLAPPFAVGQRDVARAIGGGQRQRAGDQDRFQRGKIGRASCRERVCQYV